MRTADRTVRILRSQESKTAKKEGADQINDGLEERKSFPVLWAGGDVSLGTDADAAVTVYTVGGIFHVSQRVTDGAGSF